MPETNAPSPRPEGHNQLHCGVVACGPAVTAIDLHQCGDREDDQNRQLDPEQHPTCTFAEISMPR
jgi:hypothetical protein